MVLFFKLFVLGVVFLRMLWVCLVELKEGRIV